MKTKKRVPTRLTKAQRICCIHDVASNMDINDAICMAMALSGLTKEAIEKDIGEMSSNQWRAYVYDYLTERCLA